MQKDTNRGVSRSVLAVVSAAAFLVGIYLGVIISGFTGQQERADRGVPVQESTSGAEQERITALEEAVQENPDDLESWILLGNLYFDKNQPVQAVRAYEHALEFDPDNADAWTDLGVMYRRSGQPKRAVQAFHRAIQ
ncbi:MAG: tetratricopeptide repeat protein, partial [Desulfovibrionales bacterium]